jgi:hypothetical protein
MISLYSGTPGSGKSVHAAKEIAVRLRRKNAIVLGNFYYNINLNNYKPLKMPYFTEKFSLKSGVRLCQTMPNSNKLVTDYPYISFTFFCTAVASYPASVRRLILS